MVAEAAVVSGADVGAEGLVAGEGRIGFHEEQWLENVQPEESETKHWSIISQLPRYLRVPSPRAARGAARLCRGRLIFSGVSLKSPRAMMRCLGLAPRMESQAAESLASAAALFGPETAAPPRFEGQ